jgi:hypothetical protein
VSEIPKISGSINSYKIRSGPGVSGSTVKIFIMGSLNVDPIFIPLSGVRDSGVSVQDMLFCLPFLTPET